MHFVVNNDLLYPYSTYGGLTVFLKNYFSVAVLRGCRSTLVGAHFLGLPAIILITPWTYEKELMCACVHMT